MERKDKKLVYLSSSSFKSHVAIFDRYHVPFSGGSPSLTTLHTASILAEKAGEKKQ